MKFYWIKTHWLIKKIFRSYIWDLPNSDQTVYLTFDDGPTPEVTRWVLDQLHQYHAKATFFCIGENIEKHPELFSEILEKGHAIGNHTFNHLNGWHTGVQDYIKNVRFCEESIIKNNTSKPRLFRPPYGKLKFSQSKKISKLGYKIVMWDVLSADFDTKVSPEKCTDNVLRNIRPGSVVIFHDSEKAFENLKHALPRTLEFLKKKGYRSVDIRLAPEPD